LGTIATFFRDAYGVAPNEKRHFRMNKQLLLAVIPLLLAACASTDTPNTTNASREDRVYRTGSNLPMRDPVPSSPTSVTAPPTGITATPPARTN
jgi:type IV pilus biogenesis protein CpaD/CtpE